MDHLSQTQLHYPYICAAFFSQDMISVNPSKVNEIMEYYKTQAQKFWVSGICIPKGTSFPFPITEINDTDKLLITNQVRLARK